MAATDRGIAVIGDGFTMRPVRPLQWVLVGVGALTVFVALLLYRVLFSDSDRMIRFGGLIGACFLIYCAWQWRRSRIRVDSDGIHAAGGFRSDTFRPGGSTFPPDKIIEIGWQRSMKHVAVVVRPRGGRWDDPGPNSPAVLGMLHSPGDAHAAGPDLLRDWCARHDIPFVEDGGSILKRPAPGQPGGPPAADST